MKFAIAIAALTAGQTAAWSSLSMKAGKDPNGNDNCGIVVRVVLNEWVVAVFVSVLDGRK